MASNQQQEQPGYPPQAELIAPEQDENLYGAYDPNSQQTDADGYVPRYSPNYVNPENENQEEDDDSEIAKLKKKEAECVFAESVVSSLTVYRAVMQVVLRFPLSVVKDHVSGIYEFQYKPGSILSIGYMITSVIIIIHFVFLAINTMSLLLNAPRSIGLPLRLPNGTILKLSDEEERAAELYLFKRNVAPAIVILSSFYHASVSNYVFFKRRHLAAQYYSYWAKSVEKMRIDAGEGVLGPVSVLLVFYLFVLSAILVIASFEYAPVTSGAKSVFSLLTFRIFASGQDWAIWTLPGFTYIRSAHSIVLVYGIINSKAFVLLYLWTCLLLRNAFTVWNQRLERVIHSGESEDDRIEKTINRTGFDHLFRDHICLLDLMASTDALFKGILESYYSSQVFTICFEIFHAWRSRAATNEFPGGRSNDAIVMGLFATITTVFLVAVSFAAASVSDAAIQGLDVIRRKGTMGTRNEEELHFLLTLFVSYSGHVPPALSGGGYFVLNKGFLVVMVGMILSNIIILFQFTPALIMTDETKLELIRNSLTEPFLLRISEGSENPYEYGYTYVVQPLHFDTLLNFSGNPQDTLKSMDEGNRKDLWDFVHDFDFQNYIQNLNFSGS